MAFPTDGQFTFNVAHVLTSGDYADAFNYYFSLVLPFGLLAWWIGLLIKTISRS